MSNISSRFQPAKKATVCIKNNCITVYDETAEVLNAIAITAGLLIAFALVTKAME